MPIYEYVCPRCAWKGSRIVRDKEQRDEQKCEAIIPLAGLDVLWERNAAGQIEIVSTSVVELGTQCDPNAVLRGPCEAPLARDEISLNSKMRHQWMP
jgi:hypothetical protein